VHESGRFSISHGLWHERGLLLTEILEADVMVVRGLTKEMIRRREVDAVQVTEAVVVGIAQVAHMTLGAGLSPAVNVRLVIVHNAVITRATSWF
jgi:hypothetical protein